MTNFVNRTTPEERQGGHGSNKYGYTTHNTYKLILFMDFFLSSIVYLCNKNTYLLTGGYSRDTTYGFSLGSKTTILTGGNQGFLIIWKSTNMLENMGFSWKTCICIS